MTLICRSYYETEAFLLDEEKSSMLPMISAGMFLAFVDDVWVFASLLVNAGNPTCRLELIYFLQA